MQDLSKLTKDIAKYQVVFDNLSRTVVEMKGFDRAREMLAVHEKFRKQALNPLASALFTINASAKLSASLNAMVDANRSMKDVIGRAGAFNLNISDAAGEMIKKQGELLRALEIAPAVALRRHLELSSAMSASMAAQSTFMRLESRTLGGAIRVSESLQGSLRGGLNAFASSYSKLFDYVAAQQESQNALSPVLIRYPAIECYREARLLEEITVPEEELSDSEVEVVAPVDRPLKDWLSQLDPELVDLLEGAREALRGSNPDRTRHVATSMRELFTKVLHRLAPESDVRSWTSEEIHFHNGSPTRAARLLYIAREIHAEPLSGFVDDDVRLAITLINALHSGTHQLRSPFTESQLKALVSRMESLILYLLIVAETSE